MAIPPQTVRLTVKGTGPGSEIWITGCWLATSAPVADAAALSGFLSVWATAFGTWVTAIKPFWYPSYIWTELHAYYYEHSGVSADFAASAAVTPTPGTVAGNGSPIDTCLVMSLRSNFVGRSHRGRMYLPYHKAATTTGLIAIPGDATTAATATAALLTSLHSGTFTPVIMSRTLAATTPVTSVVADERPDVQRRRVNRLSTGTSHIAIVT